MLLARCQRLGASRTRAGQLMAVRFSSSKKDSAVSETQTTPPKKSVKKEAKAKDAKLSKDLKKYVSFEDLPKPPEDFRNMSPEQFHASLHLTSVPDGSAVPKFESTHPQVGFKYDFGLSPKHILPKSPKANQIKSAGDIEPNLTLLGIFNDTDTVSSGMEEHPLRESITGLCVLNPLLLEVRNKSLWDMFPENKRFGASPYGKKFYYNAFKDWEDSKNAKLRENQSAQLAKENEIKQFRKTLHESNSFLRKPVVQQATTKKTPKTESKDTKVTASKDTSKDLAAKGATSSPEDPSSKDSKNVVETSGRRKLDRALLRQYRKYRKEQYLGKSKDEKEDE